MFINFINKNKKMLIIILLILLILILIIFKKSYTKEPFIDFNVEEIKSKLIVINDLNEINNKNINKLIDDKTKTIKEKKNGISKIINDINITITNLTNTTLFNLHSFKNKISIICSVILITFKILFKLSSKLRSVHDLSKIFKLLFYFIFDIIKCINLLLV